ncbi:hypothetical protein [Bradyrhizobium sp. 141]|uniref:hypothetical protein n=1 Tax=Bradyrhizobium sp. 141 TaxID=2782617 RepID=UPI001FF71B47|nr:hypothetical protein [Bradyrhizobium sp. 141]MCK1723288.1 hypothetical protein [Bradyrhizobium sp. 141]
MEIRFAAPGAGRRDCGRPWGVDHVKNVTPEAGQWLASARALAQQLAGGTIDQVQARAGLTRHGNMRATAWLVVKPMLHIHAGSGAPENDLTVHAR